MKDLVGSQWAFGIKFLFERRLLCWVLRTVEGDVSSLLPLSSRDRVSGCSPDLVVSDYSRGFRTVITFTECTACHSSSGNEQLSAHASQSDCLVP